MSQPSPGRDHNLNQRARGAVARADKATDADGEFRTLLRRYAELPPLNAPHCRCHQARRWTELARVSGTAMFLSIRSLALCAVALALLTPVARADAVGLHRASVHVPRRHSNNANPGVYSRSDAGWTAGRYRNSLRRTSAYAGYPWEYSSLGLTEAAVTGYRRSAQALLVPSARLFTHDGSSARLAYIPRVTGGWQC